MDCVLINFTMQKPSYIPNNLKRRIAHNLVENPGIEVFYDGKE